MGKKISLLIVILVAFNLNAQVTSLNFKKADSITYNMYLNEDWKSLIKIGEQAHKEGIDFYYLNVRLGIAYFNDNKMFSAIEMLEKAYEKDTLNGIVELYLYWAYKYSGQVLESYLFYEKMSRLNKQKINLDLPFVSSIDLSFLGTTNSDYNNLKESNGIAENNEIRVFPKSYNYYLVGLRHPLSKKVNLVHSLTFLSTTSLQQETNDNSFSNLFFDGKETRYNADLNFALGKKWHFSTFLTAISGSFDNVNAEIINNNGPRIIYSEQPNISYSDVVLGASLTKYFNYSKNTVSLSASNLNNKEQVQIGYNVSFYPLGSTNFIPFASVNFQSENNESNLIFTGGVVVSIKNVSLTSFGTFGTINNLVLNNGSLIYNQKENAKSEVGGFLTLFTKNATLKAGYTTMKMEDNYLTDNNNVLSKKYTFNQQNLILGITWNF